MNILNSLFIIICCRQTVFSKNISNSLFSNVKFIINILNFFLIVFLNLNMSKYLSMSKLKPNRLFHPEKGSSGISYSNRKLFE